MRNILILTSFIVTLLSAFQMYLNWGNPLFDAWCVGFTGWINVLFFELDKK